MKHGTKATQLFAGNLWHSSKYIFWVLLISITVLLLEQNLAYADDCRTKWWDAEDCMRTGGWGVTWATLLVWLSSLGVRTLVFQPLTNIGAARSQLQRPVSRNQGNRPPDYMETSRRISDAVDYISGKGGGSGSDLSLFAREMARIFKIAVSALAALAAAAAFAAETGAALFSLSTLVPAAIAAVIGYKFPDAIGLMTDMVLGPAPDQTSGRRRPKPKNRTVNISVGAIIGGGVMALGFISTWPFIIPGMVVGGFAGAYYNRLP